MDYTILAPIAGILALLFAAYFAWSVLKEKSGTDRMRQISGAVQEGAMAFLNRQYTTIAIFAAIIALILGVFIGIWVAIGFLVGAILSASAEGKAYDDNAMKAMGNLSGKARVTVFFLELSPSYIKASASKPVAAPKLVEPVKAAEAPRPPEAMPVIGHMPSPAEGIKSITYVLSKPAPVVAATVPFPATVPSQLKLIVVMSGDKFVGLQHRSKLMTLEALDEESVAWVDKKTIESLNAKGNHKASLILAGGKEYPVTLREADFMSEESKFIILPLKLRKRLAVSKGAMIGVKA